VEPQWLNDTEQKAWQGLLALTLLGFPELERTFKAYGLVHVEYGLLHELSQRSEGLRQCDLAEGMNVSQSRLSHRMNKLRERGLVDVLPSQEDGRVSVAYITDTGRDLLRQIAPKHLADVRQMIFDQLSDEQVTALADALDTVAAKLRPDSGHTNACIG
jgi:DNA-binding MarR family transcriptional regulator